MKQIFSLTGFLILSVFTNVDRYPEIKKISELTDGVYYIVNTETGDALTAVAAGVNSNTRVRDFKRSGMQKWTLKKRETTGKNGKLIVTWTIQHTASSFYLRPYHLPDNGNAIISEKDTYSNFTIEADEENFIIRNIKMAGDAMYAKQAGDAGDEPWFGADDNTDRYRWQLVAAQ
jgi:hypothetical protein